MAPTLRKKQDKMEATKPILSSQDAVSSIKRRGRGKKTASLHNSPIKSLTTVCDNFNKRSKIPKGTMSGVRLACMVINAMQSKKDGHSNKVANSQQQMQTISEEPIMQIKTEENFGAEEEMFNLSVKELQAYQLEMLDQFTDF